MMLSISYIVGQLNGPLGQMIELLHSTQDAKISLERLSEIQAREDEITANTNFNLEGSNADLIIQNVFFRYKGSNEFTLKNINFTIPFNKVTAIVGASGSGKTTLMKLLLKIYEPNEGEIALGHTSLRNTPHDFWRKHCGVVMQEGYLFNDTIAGNIALGTGQIDSQKLHYALTASNCTDFVNVLPLGVNTKIGYDGMSLSLGQKQRLLIARAIYRNPKFIFLDEATSSLDANNEKEVISNLEDFFNGRTVVIIAHRLSTVKNADQIIVLTKNGIAEIGDHRTLVNSKGHYYNLVKNQLELGN
jgi:ATP-binding cassette subfamily B protein